MKKRVCLFFCLVILYGAVFSQSDESRKEADAQDAEGIIVIQRDIQKVNDTLGSLEDNIKQLRKDIVSLQEKVPADVGIPFLLPALIILTGLCLLILGAGTAGWIWQKKKIEGLTKRIEKLTERIEETAKNLTRLTNTFRPMAARKQVESTSTADKPVSKEKEPMPVTPPVRAESPSADPIAELYNSEAKREARRNGYSGDKWMVVNNDVYQRILQGERIPICFEEGSNRRLAGYVLADRTHLYPNYYKFNETQPVRDDDVFGQVYEISGGMPGFIKHCEPAVMTPSGGSFTLAQKGRIELEK